jgi:SAM-dependent methyltransferase
MAGDVYMQYGCGHSAPPGWRSFDASPTLVLQRLPIVGSLARRARSPFPERVEHGDILSGLPLAPASCRGIYASHVLEHLALIDARKALRNTHALLAPGGVFRLVVPDLRSYARRYLEANDHKASHQFMEETCLGSHTRARGLKGMVLEFLGNSRHLWMWDLPSMQHELQAAGFVDIRACSAFDSEDPRFAEVEDPGRFVDALAMQCRRAANHAPAQVHAHTSL